MSLEAWAARLVPSGLLSATILMGSWDAAQAAPRGGCDPGALAGFTLDPELTQGSLPQQAQVFKAVIPDVTPQLVELVAEQYLGLQGEVTYEGGRRYVIRNGFDVFSMDSSTGAWTWHDRRFLDGRISRTDPLPSLAEAKSIADAWLAERDVQLVDGRFKRAVNNPGFVSVGYERTSSAAEYVSWGNISRAIVNVDSNGEVVHAAVSWPDYFPIGTYPLRSLEQVLGAVTTADVLYLSETTGVLTDPTLVYVADPTESAHVRPYFLFRLVGDDEAEVLVDALPPGTILP